jgi:hypothetical protein
VTNNLESDVYLFLYVLKRDIRILEFLNDFRFAIPGHPGEMYHHRKVGRRARILSRIHVEDLRELIGRSKNKLQPFENKPVVLHECGVQRALTSTGGGPWWVQKVKEV